MAAVMIGAGPHKGSHTAVAIDAAETPLGQLRVRAGSAQAGRLVEWAAEWPDRTWAVEGAGGLGHLLARQLLAAGERVVDVQPKLSSRVRLLSTGTSNKNDPNDARSVAVGCAALGRPAARAGRRPRHRAARLVAKAPAAVPAPHPGRLPPPRRPVRDHSRRSPAGHHREPGRRPRGCLLAAMLIGVSPCRR